MSLDKTRLNSILSLVNNEVIDAMRKHDKFPSNHHGWAVIKEEMDELWDAINWDKTPENKEHIQKEAIQVAAMGIRFVYDLYTGFMSPNQENQS